MARCDQWRHAERFALNILAPLCWFVPKLCPRIVRRNGVASNLSVDDARFAVPSGSVITTFPVCGTWFEWGDLWIPIRFRGEVHFLSEISSTACATAQSTKK